jgi:hypothetical protein
VPGFLQILKLLGFLREHSMVATALAATFVCWLYLNTIWPDFPLDSGESFALFLIISLVIVFASNIINAARRWVRRRR